MKCSFSTFCQWLHPSPRIVSILFGFSLLTIVFYSSASAQNTTGDIVGTVTDSTGAVVPNAQVSIINTGTQQKRQVISGGDGNYAFTLLQPGLYTLQVSALSFNSYTLTAVNLDAGVRARFDVKLQPGATAETVEVHDETIPALQTDSGTIQTTVAERQVQDLPLNNRNFIGLIQASAGINQGLPGSIASGTRPDDERVTSAYSANGQPDTMNNNMIDGLDNNEKEQGFLGIRPGIDSISEVLVMTGNYSAEIGRATGAVVNVISKAGTNNFHGTAFEFVRNDIFDARDYFSGGASKPKYRQNNFGGSLGGRILRDKTFFFTDIEFDRNVMGQTSLNTVPTADEEKDPTTVPGFVAGTPINPVALNYFKLYPAPNIPGTVSNGMTINNYVSSFPRTQNATTFDVRIDHHLSANDSLFGEYSYNPVTTHSPGAFPTVKPSWAGGQTVAPGGGTPYTPGTSLGTSQGFHLDYQHIFNPNLLLELRAGYTRIRVGTQPLNYGLDLGTKIGILNANLGDAVTSSLPNVGVSNGPSGLGDGYWLPIVDVNNTFQYGGLLTWSHGAHTFKTGGALIRRQLDYYEASNPQGSFSWHSGLAAFLMGTVDIAKQDGVPSRGNNTAGLQGWRGWEPSVFLQDDWHVKNWLTLNLGVRYEVFSPYIEAHNRFSNFDLNTLSIKVAGSSNRNVGPSTDYSDFSPRLGFAFTLPHKTVLRGGFGMSYYPVTYQSMIQNPNPPFNFSCGWGSCDQSYIFPALPLPTPASQISLTNPAGNLTWNIPKLKSAYFYQMNLFLQKQLGANVLNVGYVGTLGRRLLWQDNINQPTPSRTPVPFGTPAPPLVYATQLPLAGSIQRDSNMATNSYSSMQASLERRYSKGLTVNLNYTWAHGLGDQINPSANNTPALWTGNPHYDWSNTVLDIRHRIALSANYEIPFGKNLRGAAGLVGKGWQLNTITHWQTGSSNGFWSGYPQINLPNVYWDQPNRYLRYSDIPQNILDNAIQVAANYGLPTGPGTPNGVYCMGPNRTGHCIAPQPFGTPGTARQWSEYGPHNRAADVSMFKYFDVAENMKLQFRAEVFNVSNTPNFGLQDTGWGDYGFGTTSYTIQNPRQIQLALKLQF
jgi:hypothetical protein